MIKGILKMSAVPDRKPLTSCYLLFKVGSLDHIKSLRRGLLYMNSLAYFAGLEDEETIGLRADSDESTYLLLRSGSNTQRTTELAFEIDGNEYLLGEASTMRVSMPIPEEIMIFSMACLSETQSEFEDTCEVGSVVLSDRFAEFGTHALKIDNIKEFTNRLNCAIVNHPFLYSSDFFEGGHGLVDYIGITDHSGPMGVFRKSALYTWQREYRLCIGAEQKALNSKGALELNIGSIEDISSILTIDQLKSPIGFKRRTFIAPSS